MPLRLAQRRGGMSDMVALFLLVRAYLRNLILLAADSRAGPENYPQVEDVERSYDKCCGQSYRFALEWVGA